jgi:hypothetical protein
MGDLFLLPRPHRNGRVDAQIVQKKPIAEGTLHLIDLFLIDLCPLSAWSCWALEASQVA